MTGITRLTDIQLILLATAARRDNGSLLPPPETLDEGPARIRKAVQALIRRGLAAEAELAPGADAWRTEGNRAVGVVITAAGRAAISIDNVEAGDGPAAGASVAQVLTPPPSPKVPAPEVPAPELPSPAKLAPARTKTAEVLDLLRRESGATLDELTTATGWLPHTMRAALTGLRKKGHAIVRGKRGDTSCYTLGVGAAA